MKYLISILLILSPLSLAAKTPPADVILEEANQYTVKIRRGSTVGLNEDDGTSALSVVRTFGTDGCVN